MTVRRMALEARGVGLVYHRRGRPVTALEGVDLEVAEGESFGLIGASGAGKSSLARVLLGLTRPSSGRCAVLDPSSGRMVAPGTTAARGLVQAVFQDPASSLNPELTVERIVSEPLLAVTGMARAERAERLHTTLAEVGLGHVAGSTLPGTLSGGEQQRVALARALAPQPAVLVLDEPVSALDAVIRGEILDLIARIGETRSLTVVIVSHDVSVVRRATDRTAVLMAGRIVEHGPTERLLNAPGHPYTADLVRAGTALRFG